MTPAFHAARERELYELLLESAEENTLPDELHAHLARQAVEAAHQSVEHK